MLMELLKQLKIAFILLLVLTVLTGLLYPTLVTGIAQLLFPWQANGSLLKQNTKLIGSALIGQNFATDHYFWGRPSATSPFPYNAASSSGSNLGPSNPALLAAVNKRIAHLKQFETKNDDLIPVELVTASGSGLDPEISPLAAMYQVPRIAKARHIPAEELEALINKLTKDRTFTVLGEPRINVLELNIALDKLEVTHG